MSNFLTLLISLDLKNHFLLVMAIRNFSSAVVCYLGRSVFMYIVPISATATWLHNTEKVFLGIALFYLLVE